MTPADLQQSTDAAAVVANAGDPVSVVIDLTDPPSLPSVTIGDVTASGATVDAATIACGRALAVAEQSLVDVAVRAEVAR